MIRIWVTENQRNEDNFDLFNAMIKETRDNVQVVVAGHHIIYKVVDEVPQEIPSADCLIFNHEMAQKIWGPKWKDILTQLALEPVPQRDALLHRLYHEREGK